MERGSFVLDNKYFLLVVSVLFLFSFVSAAEINDDLHLNLQTTDSEGRVVTGTFDFQFDISTDAACSNIIYSDSQTLTTDSRGIISYYLNNTDLDYAQQYYLCYYRDSQLIDTIQIARTPYAFTAKNVNLSGVLVDSNLNLSGFNLSADYLFGDGSGLTNLPIDQAGLNYWNRSGSNLFYNDGNVGIGTDSPSQRLEVEGNIDIGTNYLRMGGGTANSYIQHDGSSLMTFSQSNWGGDFRFRAANTTGSQHDILWLEGSNQNVGIGTTNPLYSLDINSSDSNSLRVSDSFGTSFLNGGGVSFDRNTAYITGSGNLRMRSGGTDTMILDSSNRVGIGGVDPQYKLDVNGTIRAVSFIGDGSQLTNLNISGLNGSTQWLNNGSSIYYNEGNVGIGTSNPQEKLEVYNGTIKVLGESGDYSTISRTGLVINTQTYDYPQFSLINSDANWKFQLNPGGSFSINDMSTNNGVLSFNEGSLQNSIQINSGEVNLAVDGGNVGIGTDSPEEALTIVSDTPAFIKVSGDTASGGDLSGIEFGYGSGNRVSRIAGSLRGGGGGDILFQTAQSFDSAYNTKMILNREGNVGVNETSPEAKLHVSGDVIIEL